MATVLAGDDDILAPTVESVDRHVLRSERLLDEATVYQKELGVAQAAFVLEGCARGGCPTERAVELIGAVQRAGHASRDLVQSARMALQRAHRAADSAVVRPLIQSSRLDQLQSLDARVETAIRAWSIRASWYDEVMAGWAWYLRDEIAVHCEASLESGE